MQYSNVIDLREWFGREAPDSRASHEECLQLMRAFIQIGNPSLRTTVIKLAQRAATAARSES